MNCPIRIIIGGNPPRATNSAAQTILKGRRKDGTTYQFIGRPSNSPAAKAKKMFITLFGLARPPDWTPFAGPVFWSVHFCFKADTKRTRWKDTAPDTDNLIKNLKDALTETRYWNDDGQVALELVGKTWGPDPGMDIFISPLQAAAPVIHTAQTLVPQPPLDHPTLCPSPASPRMIFFNLPSRD